MQFTHFRQPLIKAENVSHQYETNTVLQQISLQIFPKEIVTLIGPNGAGKSTLLKILLGLTKPTKGKVIRQKNLKIGFMPQKIQIDPTLPMTVERFLQLGLPNTHFKTGFKQSVKNWFFKAAYSNTLIEKTTQDLDIADLLNHPIQKVSGGEMQRILLARALIREPQLLVLDEPVQGVDLQGQTEIYDYINKIRHEYGCGILMVSHDLHIVMKHTDEVLCLNQHMCCTGHPQQVSKSSEFQALFGDLSESLAFYEHHHNNEACQHTHGLHPETQPGQIQNSQTHTIKETN
ncbi:zinc import ATP-binding protein ZnuC [Thiomicrorhabdus immobilis]|uniref:Zinc import ATP-binding protein ZnuC n=1 Tax=Thiomicrorhabdus immobilis TaxID=2791037 RepID=A0ABM7MET3_9GAMM|nr:metal ABC transporter ATP-binding protein [Thiomicrorhabdus immobilis]BCN93860.1 zinc import ATP-binding protein ZnuC [Thiomicrorhabdus immobilis]